MAVFHDPPLQADDNEQVPSTMAGWLLILARQPPGETLTVVLLFHQKDSDD
jgi:hypothetical protein